MSSPSLDYFEGSFHFRGDTKPQNKVVTREKAEKFQTAGCKKYGKLRKLSSKGL